jgi:hypothetical protein
VAQRDLREGGRVGARQPTGATVAAYRLADPATSFVNDVTVTRDGAWFTDSLLAQIYFVPISPAGIPGSPRTLRLGGPAADTGGAVNLNGIAATPDGRTPPASRPEPPGTSWLSSTFDEGKLGVRDALRDKEDRCC